MMRSTSRPSFANIRTLAAIKEHMMRHSYATGFFTLPAAAEGELAGRSFLMMQEVGIWCQVADGSMVRLLSSVVLSFPLRPTSQAKYALIYEQHVEQLNAAIVRSRSAVAPCDSTSYGTAATAGDCASRRPKVAGNRKRDSISADGDGLIES